MTLNTVTKKSVAVFGIVVSFSILVACGPGPSPTPTGTPSPAPSPTPMRGPAEHHANDFGINWSSTYYSPYYSSATSQWAANAGATWDRWDFHWVNIMQPPSGTPPVWEDGQTYSYGRGIQGDEGVQPPLSILAILNGGIPNPQPNENLYADSGAWEQFVRAVQQQYGSRITAWEIGNEEGFVHEDPGNPSSISPLTPDQYADALRRACQVLGPNSTIILGSPRAQVALSVANIGHNASMTGRETRGWETYREILNRIKQDSNLQNCIDAVGVHTYLRVPWSYWIVTGLANYARSGVNNWTDPRFSITESGLAGGRCLHPRHRGYSRAAH